MGVLAALCSVAVVAGIYAVVVYHLHSRMLKQTAAQNEIEMTRTAAHGDGDADEGSGGGERPAPYLQMAVAGVPITAASAEQVQVPVVGLPVAASADGSWLGLELSPMVVIGVVPNV